MAQEPVPAPELSRLHGRISRDVGDLRARWVRWTEARRRASQAAGTGHAPGAAGGLFGAAAQLGANPEDIASAAIRTFRAMRLLQEAFKGVPPPAVLVLALLRAFGPRRR